MNFTQDTTECAGVIWLSRPCPVCVCLFAHVSIDRASGCRANGSRPTASRPRCDLSVCVCVYVYSTYLCCRFKRRCLGFIFWCAPRAGLSPYRVEFLTLPRAQFAYHNILEHMARFGLTRRGWQFGFMCIRVCVFLHSIPMLRLVRCAAAGWCVCLLVCIKLRHINIDILMHIRNERRAAYAVCAGYGVSLSRILCLFFSKISRAPKTHFTFPNERDWYGPNKKQKSGKTFLQITSARKDILRYANRWVCKDKLVLFWTTPEKAFSVDLRWWGMAQNETLFLLSLSLFPFSSGSFTSTTDLWQAAFLMFRRSAVTSPTVGSWSRTV